MSPPELSSEAVQERSPESLVEAGSYRTEAEGFDHGLVVLAAGSACWLVPGEAGYRLLVEPEALDPVREQLTRFDRESIGWPPPPVREDTPARKTEMLTPLLWGAIVLAIFWGQGTHPTWTKLGLLDPFAVFERGEVWRLATALFLHADPGHAISNCLSGIFVFAAVLTTIGLGRGWLLLAVAAIAGNLVTAALHYGSDYRSLGASTAIFAGLGLLTGRAVRMIGGRRGRALRRRSRLVPFAAGLTMLGLFGAGRLQVDGVAHATGFAAGLVLGFVEVSRSETGEADLGRV